MPAVSVIVPTYNRAKFIFEAVQSVLDQSFRDIEVLVVDDGSTDDTLAVLSTIKDKRLRVYPSTNRGRSSTRNMALAFATGEFVAFNDSDDLYLPGKLEMQVRYLRENPKVAMVYTAATHIDDAGSLLPGRYDAKASGDIYYKVAFFRPITIALPTVMVRAQIVRDVGAFDDAQTRFEDTDLWRRISREYLVHGIDIETCAIRTHVGNSLRSLDPGEIMVQLDYYIAKIKVQDRPRGRWVCFGLSRLYGHYAQAFATVPEWKPDWELLFKSQWYELPLGRYWYPIARYIYPHRTLHSFVKTEIRSKTYAAKMHFLNFAYHHFARARNLVRSLRR
ncbi:glycosyl transferase family A [Rhizobium leguminosarum bv. trifolii CB782]|nr:glycosyl transferase family A [Rhizobium leguminosarum bv. trifolii CB782]